MLNDMDPRQGSKPMQKKASVSSDKQKKANKKKKKSRKLSSKLSPDGLEVEGTGVLNTGAGAESDSSQQSKSQPGTKSQPSQPQIAEELLSQDASSTSCATIQNGVDFVQSNASENTLVENQETPEVSVNTDCLKSPSSTSVDVEENIPSTLSNMSIRQKTKGSRTKGGNTRSQNQNGAKNSKKNESGKTNGGNVAKFGFNSESLRWEISLENPEEEQERILIYKMNRRKRYLAAAQAKGLGWVTNYGTNGSPVSEDSGIDTRERENHMVTNFKPIKGLGPSHSSSALTSGSMMDYV